ncbi:MAG: L-2-amino-thiazoline-4-carboxylic acid hydrolase [Oscillospiraceae bacterium]|nr:L-2-amino-thiazoline-4-carboxylic acid hydrolase [Oscillospiraceae bacterium]
MLDFKAQSTVYQKTKFTLTSMSALIKTNPLLPGLYLAAYALAFHKAYPEHIDGEALGEMTDLLAASDIMKKLYEGKDFFSEKNISSRATMAKEPAELYPENWKYDFHVDMDKRECFMNYHSCAICNMCKREGCFDLLKYMCKIDFVSQDLMGNTLIRTKTLAEGYDGAIQCTVPAGRCGSVALSRR